IDAVLPSNVPLGDVSIRVIPLYIGGHPVFSAIDPSTGNVDTSDPATNSIVVSDPKTRLGLPLGTGRVGEAAARARRDPVRSYARARRRREALLPPGGSGRARVAGVGRHGQARLGPDRGSLGQGVGEAMGQGMGPGALMQPGPPPTAERIVALLTPPACREH